MAETGAESPQVGERQALHRNWKARETQTGLKFRGVKSRGELAEDKRGLEQRVNIDPLTGLEGEYPLQDMIAGLETRYEADYPKGDYLKGTFIIVDADDLHGVNRTYGERAGGDDYLISVGDRLKEVTRGRGRCFRRSTSGDDFVLYLPGFKMRSEIEQTLDELDDKLRESQDSAQEKYPGIKYSLSYSIATFHRAYSPRQAFNDAYNTLKEAKESKRTGERAGNVGRHFVNELTPEDRKYE